MSSKKCDVKKGVYIIALAGTDGLEPSLRESKSRALPLRYVPINGFKVSQPRILARFNVMGGTFAHA